MSENYKKLVERLTEVTNLNRASAVLGWDQQVNMPPAGAGARAAQMGTLARIAHEMFTSDETGRLIEQSAADLRGAPYDSDEASLVRVVRQDYEELTRVPTEHVVEMTQVTIMAHEVWVNARANNDFNSFLPTLERMIDLSLKTAEYLGYTQNPYDALLGLYERGITAARIKEIFDGHKPQLVALIAAIRDSGAHVDDSILHQPFTIDKQREFGMWVVEKFGFDLNRGRQDVAVHPFATHFSVNDVRITTRFHDDFLNPALFGLMHETGHGLYEMGVSEHLDFTPLGAGASLGVHESQSRMWENIVGRSRGFWSWALPKLKETFPQLGDVDVDTFYKAINKVNPSYIRVEADEATYNLHIMLRFELENDMLNGRVALSKLPQEWNARFESYLGLTPPTDTLGVLQDVHWSSGLIGYFPTYALGNLLSVQYYNKAIQDHPSLPDEIASGQFGTLLNWLKTNIHQHGRKFTSEELTRRVTGQSIDSAPYITYLQTKFGEIYGL